MRPNHYVKIVQPTRCDQCDRRGGLQDIYGKVYCDTCAPPLADLDIASTGFAAGGD